MVEHQLARLDWLDERDKIKDRLTQYRNQYGRCPATWREVTETLRAVGLEIDRTTGAPLDPSGIPYRLIDGGCDVDLDPSSKVPR
jgi:hypothetical protein